MSSSNLNKDFSRLRIPSYSHSEIPENHPISNEFDAFLELDGGRLKSYEKHGDIGRVVSWYKRRYWFILNRLKQAQSHNKIWERTYFDVVDNPRFEALAFPLRDYEIITFFAGTIVNIASMFFLFYSHPKFRPDVGNPENEESTPFVDLSSCYWTRPINEIMSSVRPGLSSKLVVPRDPKRYEAAVADATQALDFLFFHELHHLGWGHFNYLSSQFDVKKMSESDPIQNVPVETLKVLELIADESAAVMALGSLMGLQNENGFGNNTAFYNNLSDAVTSWVLSIATLFFVLDQQHSMVSEYSREYHPHTAVRFMSILTHAAGHSVFEQHKETIDKSIEFALGELAEFQTRFKLVSSFSFAIKNTSKEVLESLVSTKNHQVKIMSDLRNFTRWGPVTPF